MRKEFNKLTRGAAETTWIIVGILVIVTIIVFGAYANNRNVVPEDIDTDISETVDQEFDLNLIDPDEETLVEIRDNPERFYGQRVQVRGEVEDVLSANVFVLDVPGLLNDELLVVTQEPFDVAEMEQQDLSIDGDAYVEGTLREFQMATYTDTDMDFDPDIMTVYEGEPVLVASSVVLEQE